MSPWNGSWRVMADMCLKSISSMVGAADSFSGLRSEWEGDSDCRDVLKQFVPESEGREKLSDGEREGS